MSEPLLKDVCTVSSGLMPQTHERLHTVYHTTNTQNFNCFVLSFEFLFCERDLRRDRPVIGRGFVATVLALLPQLRQASHQTCAAVKAVVAASSRCQCWAPLKRLGVP